MKYFRLTQIDKPISRIILGCAAKGFWHGKNQDELLNHAISIGVTSFDTARGYGDSENVLGNFIKKNGLKNKVFVQTKGGLHGLLGNSRINKKCLICDLEKSLTALNTDCIDTYILHRDNEKIPAEEITEWLNSFIKEGKIKTWGVSNWKHTRIDKANGYAAQNGLSPIVLSQPQFSLAVNKKWAWLGCVSITGKDNIAARKWYRDSQLPVTAFSPLANGFLSGKVKSKNIKETAKSLNHAAKVSYLNEDNIIRLRRAEELAKEKGLSVPQIALAYILSDTMNTFAIVGNSRKESLSESVAAADIILTPKERSYLNLET